ncbi:outer membrane protein assembly factor BamB family protein [Cellulomonas sp. URHB0016]
MSRHEELRDVELVEDDLAPAPAGRPTRLRVPRRWLVAGAAVAVVAVGLNQWVSTSREDAAVARLTGVPGVLAPVDGTLTVGRHVPDDEIEDPAPTRGGTLRREHDGSLSFRWVGAAGAGWTASLLPADPRLADAGHVWSTSDCATDAPPAADPLSATRVVCLVADGGSVASENGKLEPVPTTSVSVVVLSAADGSVETRWPVPSGEAMALLPGGLVTVGWLADRTAAVTGYDMLTGAERWTYEQPVTPTADAQRAGFQGVSLLRSGDLVAFVPPDRATVLLSTDGKRVRGDLLDPGSEAGGIRYDPRTGRLAVSTEGAAGSIRSTFVAPDGNPEGDLVVHGSPLYVTVDDGSVPGTALTADDRTVRGAGADGSRWSADVEAPSFALVLRGRVLVSCGHGVVAIDGRSGHVLWRTAGEPGLAPGNLMTDGRHVLVAYEQTGPDARAAVVAYDPASGQEMFRAPYPEGVVDVNPWGRHLMATESGGAAVLLD